jgi:hypothetical protein
MNVGVIENSHQPIKPPADDLAFDPLVDRDQLGEGSRRRQQAESLVDLVLRPVLVPVVGRRVECYVDLALQEVEAAAVANPNVLELVSLPGPPATIDAGDVASSANVARTYSIRSDTASD